LALQDVWTEPAAEWMKDCLRDETQKLSAPGWLLILELGAAAPALLLLLRTHGLLPDRVEFAPFMEMSAAPAAIEYASTPAAVTIGAAWLCEALDNLLASLPDLMPKRSFDPAGSSHEAMLWRALRAMSEADWRSLDRFPERASKVRNLTDKFAAQVRHLLEGPTPSIAKRLENWLAQSGMPPIMTLDEGAFLVETEKGLCLIQALDLQQHNWTLPAEHDGDWTAAGMGKMAPFKRLRQKAARWTLRHGRDIRMLVLALDQGAIGNSSRGSKSVFQPERGPQAALAWLVPKDDDLPSLHELLSAQGNSASRPLNVRPATVRPALTP
jgi:hypothetical protein